ncbi:MAG TPA: succinate--CoA ligase subunit alpha [Chloroflexota bacterium]|jgi:succinyl-CoA synthetase alpha subunit
MSVLVNRDTRLLVQGITGQAASAHTERMLAYGTRVVGGVVPGRGGGALHGVPVYDTVAEARAATGANTSVLYLPPAAAAGGLLEAIEAEVPLVVCLTEGVPLHDMLLVRERLRRSATRLLGPNVPGIVSPGEALVGFVPERACAPGAIGVASRSGTLAYECGLALVQAGLGQSTWVGIGGDLVRGLGFREVVALFEADPGTEAILLIGEIGGAEEEDVAAYLAERSHKPTVALLAGRTAPADRAMGHAGALVLGGAGSFAQKAAAFARAGVPLVASPREAAARLRALLRR